MMCDKQHIQNQVHYSPSIGIDIDSPSYPLFFYLYYYISLKINSNAIFSRKTDLTSLI